MKIRLWLCYAVSVLNGPDAAAVLKYHAVNYNRRKPQIQDIYPTD